MSFRLREKRETDHAKLAEVWTGNYGGVTVISRGQAHRPLELPGLVADENGELLGAVTWHRAGDQFEVVTLDSFKENLGVGTALLEAVAAFAREQGAARLWLITSNDNTRAIRFYQRRGWDMVAFHRNAVSVSRKLKPEIPLLGDDGIPVRHEMEFELRLR